MTIKWKYKKVERGVKKPPISSTLLFFFHFQRSNAGFIPENAIKCQPLGNKKLLVQPGFQTGCQNLTFVLQRHSVFNPVQQKFVPNVLVPCDSGLNLMEIRNSK